MCRMLWLITLFVHLAMVQCSAPTQPISIDIGSKVMARASPWLSGLGIEDVNHELYGGLYSQMVFGESFEEPAGPDGVSGSSPWVVPTFPGCFGTSQGPTFELLQGTANVTDQAFTGNQSQRLHAGAAIANAGLLGVGMSFVEGKTYEGSIYVRGSGRSELTISITVGGEVVSEVAVARQWTSSWQRVGFTLTPNSSSVCKLTAPSVNHTSQCNEQDRLTGCIDGCVASPELGARCMACDGRLVLAVVSGEALDLDQVSLHPGAWGLFQGLPVRKDLGELMMHANKRGMGLSSLRLGGSMVLNPDYRWKNFRGPRELRQPYKGVWYRYNSGGWKIFEYLDFCEAAGIQACVVTLPVTETTEDLEDLMEYCFGNSTTEFGALRAKDGRTKPYAPFLVEIGNENVLNFTGKLPPGLSPSTCREECYNFTERWVAHALAMDAKAVSLGVQNLTFIVGFDAASRSSCTMQTVKDAAKDILHLAELARSLGSRAVWDCHTGGDRTRAGNDTAAAISELQSLLHGAGSLMRAAVLEENGDTHNILRMLGHVTQTHALSRLGDFVVVNTVANGLQPLGRNSNGWDQGNIFFTPEASWLTPPAVASQMMVSASSGLRNILSVSPEFPGGLDVLASGSDDGVRLSVQVANPTNTSVTAYLVVGAAVSSMYVEELSSEDPTSVYATPTGSDHVVTAGKLQWTFLPYSFSTFKSKYTDIVV